MQNCAELCKTVQTVWLVARGWLAAGVQSGQWAHISSSISSLQEEKLSPSPAQPAQPSAAQLSSQPSPASGVWRNGVTQARPRAAPNLGWTGHPAPAPLKVTGDPGHHLIHHQQQQQPADTRHATRFPGHRKTPPPRTRQHSTAQVTEFAQQTCKKYFMMSCLKSTQYSEKALQYYKCAFSFLQLKQSKISSLV